MYLGIDIGTSSVTAIVVGDDGEITANASAPLAISRPRPHYCEQDPEAWWQATVQAFRTLPTASRQAVRAMGMAGRMQGATVLDASDRPLRPAILWNDGRSVLECTEIEEAEPATRRITGNRMMPGFGAPKLLWLRKHEPDLFGRIASVLSPKDYVRLKLTGEKVTDMSDASGTALLDVGRRDWSARMLAVTGLDRSHLPALAEGNAAAGTLMPWAMEQLDLPRIVVAAGGDHSAARAAGMGSVAPGQAFLSLGPAGVLFVSTDRFRPSDYPAVHELCHCLPGRWGHATTILTTACALEWLARLMAGGSSQELIASLQGHELHRGSPFFLPYLSGESTSHSDPLSQGVFHGLGSDASPTELTIAVLEGVALGFADGSDELDIEISSVGMTGSGARIDYWGELMAAALDRPLTYHRGAETSVAYGAARLARLALTGETPERVCVPLPITRVVEPEPALTELLAERRQTYRRLQGDLRATLAEVDG